ncbi:MAG TPA: helix-turn-helix domain-containing protein [Candidatus Thermoplasmatota archaeon]|nr:helix-turn-helix domain-containing protein [Candidatus Thermoplasmatota archaeon]
MRHAVDRLSALIGLGLSDAEAGVFLALLDHGSLPAGLVAKASRLPRNRAYETLESLHGKGLIEILPGRVRQFRARPVSEFLDTRIEECAETIRELQGRRPFAEAVFVPAQTQEADSGGSTSRILLGRRAVAREIDRLLGSAKERVVAAASAGGSERLLLRLAAAAERDPSLAFEVVLPHAAATAGLERLPAALASGLCLAEATLACEVLVVDDAHVLVNHPVPDDAHARLGRDFAFYARDPSLARDQRLLLECLRLARGIQAAGVCRPADNAEPNSPAREETMRRETKREGASLV